MEIWLKEDDDDDILLMLYEEGKESRTHNFLQSRSPSRQDYPDVFAWKSEICPDNTQWEILEYLEIKWTVKFSHSIF